MKKRYILLIKRSFRILGCVAVAIAPRPDGQTGERRFLWPLAFTGFDLLMKDLLSVFKLFIIAGWRRKGANQIKRPSLQKKTALFGAVSITLFKKSISSNQFLKSSE
jgi:hypothetical protein